MCRDLEVVAGNLSSQDGISAQSPNIDMGYQPSAALTFRCHHPKRDCPQLKPSILGMGGKHMHANNSIILALALSLDKKHVACGEESEGRCTSQTHDEKTRKERTSSRHGALLVNLLTPLASVVFCLFLEEGIHGARRGGQYAFYVRLACPKVPAALSVFCPTNLCLPVLELATAIAIGPFIASSIPSSPLQQHLQRSKSTSLIKEELNCFFISA
eukprot:scaffold137648_cov15-Tisochrysis_lutea.AAC.1